MGIFLNFDLSKRLCMASKAFSGTQSLMSRRGSIGQACPRNAASSTVSPIGLMLQNICMDPEWMIPLSLIHLRTWFKAKEAPSYTDKCMMQELANLMAAICVAAAGIIIGGFLALPTLAGQQCKSNLAKSLRGTGQRLSGSVFVLVNNSFHLQQFLHLVFMSQVPARERRCENTASKLVLIGFAATWRQSLPSSCGTQF